MLTLDPAGLDPHLGGEDGPQAGRLVSAQPGTHLCVRLTDLRGHKTGDGCLQQHWAGQNHGFLLALGSSRVLLGLGVPRARRVFCQRHCISGVGWTIFTRDPGGWRGAGRKQEKIASTTDDSRGIFDWTLSAPSTQRLVRVRPGRAGLCILYTRSRWTRDLKDGDDMRKGLDDSRGGGCGKECDGVFGIKIIAISWPGNCFGWRDVVTPSGHRLF